MPQRNCNRTKEKVTKQSKTIRLPIELDKHRAIIGDRKRFRKLVDRMIEQYPELFPEGIKQAWVRIARYAYVGQNAGDTNAADQAQRAK